MLYPLHDRVIPMTIRSAIMKVLQQDALNFALTNWIPRRAATSFMGWFSKLENPLIRGASIGIWRFFSDVDLRDARETQFNSLHHCFVRTLKDGARTVDMAPTIVVSPCDGIIGAAGSLNGIEALQVKNLPYAVEELLGDAAQAETFRDGSYVTLRLTAGMYHRFHAPHDCRVDAVTHVFGDVWNVNPVTLKRVKRLFCRNERAILRTTLTRGNHPVTLVAVAAILVAGIRLNFLEMPVGPERKVTRTYRTAVSRRKGEEMGWFEHGSTILVFAPAGFTLCPGLTEGMTIRMGQGLLQMPDQAFTELR
jgi:phosphatidylserine decarboxylase